MIGSEMFYIQEWSILRIFLYVGFDVQRNLCDKQNVLFYGTPRSFNTIIQLLQRSYSLLNAYFQYQVERDRVLWSKMYGRKHLKILVLQNFEAMCKILDNFIGYKIAK